MCVLILKYAGSPFRLQRLIKKINRDFYGYQNADRHHEVKLSNEKMRGRRNEQKKEKVKVEEKK